MGPAGCCFFSMGCTASLFCRRLHACPLRPFRTSLCTPDAAQHNTEDKLAHRPILSWANVMGYCSFIVLGFVGLGSLLHLKLTLFLFTQNRTCALQVSLLAWTTTPWTLPSNLALCVNKAFDYVKLR